MNNLDLLVPQAPTQRDTWHWATITQADPLRIRLDGDDASLDVTPDSLYAPPQVGQRVWVQMAGKRLIVHAPAGGASIGTGSPVGSVTAFAGDSAPLGWLMCDGGTFDSGVYPDLAALVGDKFGVHSGTTYYLPNLKGRVPVGLDTSQVEFDTLGESGGEKAHALTASEMPAHKHGLNNAGAALYLSGKVYSKTRAVAPWTSDRNWSASGPVADTTATNIGSAGNVAILGTTDDASVSADGGAHNNLQPYTVLNYIIRATP